MNTKTDNAGDGPAERGVRPALDSEALLHAAKCRTWAAKTFNDTPDAALCVEAGDRLLYAAQLLDAQALEINRLRAGMGALIRERRGAESIREGLQLLMRCGPNNAGKPPNGSA